MPNLVHVPGIENTSEAFRNKVIAIASELQTDPNFLMAVMSFESGATFRPDIKNAAGSGAVGLIQFMPKTAQNLGTSTAALAAMSAVAQLDFVRKYLLPFKGRMKTVEDAYMAVLMPSAIGKGSGHVLFKRGTTAYKQNSGLDLNGDGLITVAEAAKKVSERLGTQPVAAQPLKKGDHGPAVEMLQHELIDLGYLTLQDFNTGPGTFGPKTEKALQAFQADIKLDGNGVYDAATQLAVRQLNEGVKKGSQGGVVAAMQQRLIVRKLLTAADVATGPGTFGPRTQNALITFQMKVGLEPNGMLTDETFRALFKKELPAPAPTGDNTVINVVLPQSGTGFTTYNREPGGADQHGTQLTINALIDVAQAWALLHPEVLLQFGDISRRGGGAFPPHKAHKKGREVDVRPLRKDNLLAATNIHDPSYDSKRTGEFVKLVRTKHPGVTIFFNDPKLINAGLTKQLGGHNNHLHLRFP
jgi:peptidoglycan hydrolase-like protein with peptidoglycan-binding domain